MPENTEGAGTTVAPSGSAILPGDAIMVEAGGKMVEEGLSGKVMDIVSYHQPDEEGIKKITAIRQATANLLLTIMENCPKNADRSAAIRKAREAMMTANASIVVPPVQL